MKTKNKVYDIYNKCLSLFFPDRCAICGKVTDAGEYVCTDCTTAFPRKQDRFSIGRYLCYSVCEYNDNIQSIVIGGKKHRDFSKLSFMATEIYDLLRAYGIIDDVDVIIPVPMGRIKRITRGYNHTEKMARHLSYLSGIETVKALCKIKETKEQKTLGRQQRLHNLEGCYRLSEKAVYGKTVLVIDDVTTTGSTLIEVSNLLKSNGNKVICAVFARTPFKERE